MKKILLTSAVLVAVGGLAGCSNMPFGKDHFDDNTYASTSQSHMASARGAGSDASIEERNAGATVAGKQVFYFKFDNSTVSQKDYSNIREQAKYLSSHPNAKIMVDGHTDERGAREYNLALGERRANSVAELLKLQGANPKQIEVVTHGQEKPVALGHNEDSWRLNRRVEMKYKTY